MLVADLQPLHFECEALALHHTTFSSPPAVSLLLSNLAKVPKSLKEMCYLNDILC